MRDGAVRDDDVVDPFATGVPQGARGVRGARRRRGAGRADGARPRGPGGGSALPARRESGSRARTHRERLSLDVELAAGAARRAGRNAGRGGEPGRVSPQPSRICWPPRRRATSRPSSVGPSLHPVPMNRASRRASTPVSPSSIRRGADVHLARCARRLVVRAPRGEAIDCLVRARSASGDRRERFALGLMLLDAFPADVPDPRRGCPRRRAARPRGTRRWPSSTRSRRRCSRSSARTRPRGSTPAWRASDVAARGSRLADAARWSEAARSPRPRRRSSSSG